MNKKTLFKNFGDHLDLLYLFPVNSFEGFDGSILITNSSYTLWNNITCEVNGYIIYMDIIRVKQGRMVK